MDAAEEFKNLFIVKWLKWIKAILSVAVVLGGGGIGFHFGADSVSPVGRARNRYEAAQHSTVLLVAKDGSQGTGIVVKRGDRIFIWTANHVVENSPTIVVKSIVRHNFHRVGETVFSGRVIAANKALDVALVYVDAPANYFLPVEFDNAVPPAIGSALYHVGNFLGVDFDTSVSTGVLSQHGAKPLLPDGWPWIITDQMTSAVAPGSSGGPVFSAKNDKVVGIVVGHISPMQMYFYVPVRALEAWADSEGLGWAVRGNESPRVLPSLPAPVLIPFRLFSIQ